MSNLRVVINSSAISALARSEDAYRVCFVGAGEANRALTTAFKRPATTRKTVAYDGRARVDVEMKDMGAWDFKYQRFQKAVMTVARVA